MKLCRTVAVCLLIGLLAFQASAELKIEVAPAKKAEEKTTAKKIDVPKPGGGKNRPKGNQPDVVKFLNKDLLHGNLVRVEHEEGLTWRHAHVQEPIVFGLANVNEIVLGSAPQRDSAKGLSRVVLTNGDALLGGIVELTAEHLILDTWYAGQMKIERPMVQSLAPNVSVSAYVYEGPDGKEGWKIESNNRGTWKYQNGAFISTGGYSSLGRDVKLPDQARIEFDLEWRGQLGLNMFFYTDKLSRGSSGRDCYSLQFNYDYIYLRRYTHNRGSQNLGNYNMSGLNNRGKGRFTILASKEKKTVAVLLDDAMVKQWVDPAGFKGKGTGIVFYPSNNARLRISNIRVSKWDGSMAAGPSNDPAKEEDLIRFANNDKVSGSLQTIKDGKITFKTAYATLDVPIDRAALIMMAEKNRERARRNKNDVSAFFHSGGSVTLNIEKIDAGKLEGSTENFGEGTFKMGAFRKIRFNVYKERPDEDGDAW